jgi:3-oxoacyl-[acyl-carrier protein] reductase
MAMNLQLNGKVALVCGASKGMGLACAQVLAAEGTKILMVARDPGRLEEAAGKIKADGGEAFPMAGDVADSELPARAVDECCRRWGGLHILVNNAGGPPPGGFLEHSAEVWQSALERNLMSVVRFCQAAAPVMRRQHWGRILSITSTIAKEPSWDMVLSATARAGVSAFTKSIANELAPFNISANVICPGGVLTDRLIGLLRAGAERENRNYDEMLKESQASIPAGRFAQPEEIARVIAFLASDMGGYVNGVSLSVDGALSKSY